MSSDDFDVIVYKVLAYSMKCVKQGVEPSTDIAQDIAKCNDVYWYQVIASMLSDELIADVYIPEYIDRKVKTVPAQSFRITQKGAMYLRDNSKMSEVKAFLGKAFEIVLDTTINSMIAAGLGAL